jgi:SAM-dependent methyltransferase
MPPANTHDRTEPLGVANPSSALFIVSIASLFLELVLIRWIGTEIRIFAYLQNTVLVVCFLGLGLGCFTCTQPIRWRDALGPLFILTLLIAVPVTREVLGRISAMLSVLGDSDIWEQGRSPGLGHTIYLVAVGLALTFGLMLLIHDMFVPLGRLLGRLLDEHPSPIWAYSVNVAGSLLGTWLLVALSLINLPPGVWVAVFAALVLLMMNRKQASFRLNGLLLAAAVGLAWLASWQPGATEVAWSPYQKLVLREARPERREIGTYIINVNNVSYQEMLDLSPARTGSRPDLYAPRMAGLSQYDIPFTIHPRPDSILIVGAGSGNDAAGAVRAGVRKITAVEIDPAIISMGKRYHPERPYQAAGLSITNDDARSFFATTSQRFDVISFSLLDAHTATAMTNARLDNYVYTTESIARAKALLRPGGVLILNFMAHRHFIADRMGHVLREVFGEAPFYFRVPDTSYGRGGIVFIAGALGAVRRQTATNVRLGALIKSWQEQSPFRLSYTTRLATDDWPYIYLESNRIPLLYYLLAGLMPLLLVRSCRTWRVAHLVRGWTRSHWHFFFLGAAFLLLEVQNISKAAVVLGNTWDVNAVIISGVLVMILLANLTAHQLPRLPLALGYALLIATCVALYFVDLSRFAFLPYAVKAVVVGGLVTLPMLFSGIVFIRSFSATESKSVALGANLVGAMVGGLLQSITFVVGIRALLLIVAGLYLLSLLTRPQVERRMLP